MEVGANRDLAASMAAGEGGILPGKAGEESDVVSRSLPRDGTDSTGPRTSPETRPGLIDGDDCEQFKRGQAPLDHSTPLVRAMYSAGLT